MKIDIPNYKSIDIKNIVFDYNGTLANSGKLSKKTKKLLHNICKEHKVFVITADTFGSVKKELKEFNLEVIVLSSNNHTKEKAKLIKQLSKNSTIALGNGNNDAKMLKIASISFCIIGKEGASKKALKSANIVCNSINSAIEILLNKNKLIATLRK